MSDAAAVKRIRELLMLHRYNNITASECLVRIDEVVKFVTDETVGDGNADKT